MATRQERIEHWDNGKLVNVEYIDMDFPDEAPVETIAPETVTIPAKRLEVEPVSGMSGDTGIILRSEDGSRWELRIDPDGNLGSVKL